MVKQKRSFWVWLEWLCDLSQLVVEKKVLEGIQRKEKYRFVIDAKFSLLEWSFSFPWR